MVRKTEHAPCRNFVLVLGDQLNADSTAFEDFDRDSDIVWMAEVTQESTHVWTHKARIVMFLAAMRHFRHSLAAAGIRVHYRQLHDRGNQGSLTSELAVAVKKLKPQGIVLVEPGEWWVRHEIEKSAAGLGIELDIRPVRYFCCSVEEFAAYAKGRRQLRLEYFYREMRRKHKVLMEGAEPGGGRWNFDKENGGSFAKNCAFHSRSRSSSTPPTT